MEKAANDNKPPLMSPKEASAMTTISRVQLGNMAKYGCFPAAVKIGEKRIAFVRAEVEAWIEAKIAERRAAA